MQDPDPLTFTYNANRVHLKISRDGDPTIQGRVFDLRVDTFSDFAFRYEAKVKQLVEEDLRRKQAEESLENINLKDLQNDADDNGLNGSANLDSNGKRKRKQSLTAFEDQRNKKGKNVASMKNSESHSIYSNESIIDATKKQLLENNRYQMQKKCSFIYEQIERNLKVLTRMEDIVENPAKALEDNLLSKMKNAYQVDRHRKERTREHSLLLAAGFESGHSNIPFKTEIDGSKPEVINSISDYIIDSSKQILINNANNK